VVREQLICLFTAYERHRGGGDRRDDDVLVLRLPPIPLAGPVPPRAAGPADKIGGQRHAGERGSGSCAPPIPLGEIGTGAPADLLDAARQELGLLLLGVDANDDLVDALWRSLLRCERIVFVVPDIEGIAPAASSSERQIVVRSDAEVRSFVEGGFLDQISSRHLLRFTSPDVQAVLAAGLLVSAPDRTNGIIEQLPVSAAARGCVEAALRLDADAGRVHQALLAAVTAATSAGAEAAALGLALTWPPPSMETAVEADLARRLALALADRAAGAGGPVLSTSGMRDAVAVLDRHVRHDAEQYLLLALHSSSFPVRLSVALALLRRDSPRALLDNVDSWIAAAESPTASGVQHQLGLALWFCPYLRESAPDGRGAQLFRRGLRLSSAADSNPLMFETSLCRGFKLAAWVHPDAGPDPAAIDLLEAGPRFWYSRISLIHALGIRLASSPAANSESDTVRRSHAALRTSAEGDPHPLVRQAAALVVRGLADGAPLVQNIRRSHYEPGIDVEPSRRPAAGYGPGRCCGLSRRPAGRGTALRVPRTPVGRGCGPSTQQGSWASWWSAATACLAGPRPRRSAASARWCTCQSCPGCRACAAQRLSRPAAPVVSANRPPAPPRLHRTGQLHRQRRSGRAPPPADFPDLIRRRGGLELDRGPYAALLRCAAKGAGEQGPTAAGRGLGED